MYKYMKVAFCVPSTSKNRLWNDINQSYLFEVLLPSMTKLTNCFDITLYIGYDDDDELYSSVALPQSFDNINIIWNPFNGFKGNPCGIWTELSKTAIKDGFEYLFICGDDIKLDKRNEWLGVFIKKLKKNNNIGYSAGWSNNNQIPTQFLIHKTHFNIFGFTYPPQIKNYQCDDWMFHLYGDKYGNWLKDYQHLNVGGVPRYIPDNCIALREILVKRHIKLIKNYVNRINS